MAAIPISGRDQQGYHHLRALPGRLWNHRPPGGQETCGRLARKSGSPHQCWGHLSPGGLRTPVPLCSLSYHPTPETGGQAGRSQWISAHHLGRGPGRIAFPVEPFAHPGQPSPSGRHYRPGSQQYEGPVAAVLRRLWFPQPVFHAIGRRRLEAGSHRITGTSVPALRFTSKRLPMFSASAPPFSMVGEPQDACRG